MVKTRMEQQVQHTVKLLILLLADPHATASTLAKAVGLGESWVNIMVMRFRDAGLDIEYDRRSGRYRVDLGDKITAKLEPMAKRLRKAIEEVQSEKPEVKFVHSLDRYSVKQFADHIGGTPSNVYNMISGYKGAKLPAGWCAYQLAGQGKWWVQKMSRNGADTKFEVPAVALNAKSLVVGEGEQLGKKDLIAASTCIVADCKKPVMSRGFCADHYYKARRHPDKYPHPKDDGVWPPSAKKKKASRK